MKSLLKQTQVFHIAAALFALCVFSDVRAQSVLMSPAEEVTAMDLDGDGKLSPAEHTIGARVIFEQLDADHDGKLTAAELDTARAQGQLPVGTVSSQRLVQAMDSNRDGVLTLQEYAFGSSILFEMMDADTDGYVSIDEMQAGRQLLISQRGLVLSDR